MANEFDSLSADLGSPAESEPR